jgi:hypothetical protein
VCSGVPNGTISFAIAHDQVGAHTTEVLPLEKGTLCHMQVPALGAETGLDSGACAGELRGGEETVVS